MALINKLVELYDELIGSEFPVSAEGTTGSGAHEHGVAKFFESKGFASLPKRITNPQVYTKGKNAGKPKGELYVMNQRTHSPTADILIEVPDGFYHILQPYGDRAAFNPAPDLYVVRIVSKRITEFVGIECKSSKGMTPTWNEHLPRPYAKGNILYLFTGIDNEKKMNTCFTAEVFFNGNDASVIETDLWPLMREILQKTWKEKGYTSKFPRIVPNLRQFCGQLPLTAEDMKMFTEKTKTLLPTLESFVRNV